MVLSPTFFRDARVARDGRESGEAMVLVGLKPCGLGSGAEVLALSVTDYSVFDSGLRNR